MIRTEKRLRICVTLLVLLLAFIWGNSLMSAEVSRAFSDLVGWILRMISQAEITGITIGGSGILRKIAHFTEFAALGMCLCWLLGMLQKHPAFALLWGALAACVDETIQCFAPDRGPSLWDVGLDSCGVAAGIIFLLAGHALCKKYFGGK